jgi:hypothetical protein
MRKHLGPKHKAVGSIMKNIVECRQGYLHENEEKITPARQTQLLQQVLPLATEATEIARTHATDKENDESYLDALYSQGEIFIQLERYAEALPCFEANLPFLIKSTDRESTDTLLCWRSLSACYKVRCSRAHASCVLLPHESCGE